MTNKPTRKVRLTPILLMYDGLVYLLDVYYGKGQNNK